ncbi:hypothetical protein [Luteithermobacter gelatinilyticus]|uniref:hypothetical protein n=1 Tax=Luteithermobacter gelatinilyticus TaxID=2582913 RepID=UPI00143DC862|nr:hypothetical protein [Luteithermobacter gelatinilyticus]
MGFLRPANQIHLFLKLTMVLQPNQFVEFFFKRGIFAVTEDLEKFIITARETEISLIRAKCKFRYAISQAPFIETGIVSDFETRLVIPEKKWRSNLVQHACSFTPSQYEGSCICYLRPHKGQGEPIR